MGNLYRLEITSIKLKLLITLKLFGLTLINLFYRSRRLIEINVHFKNYYWNFLYGLGIESMNI